MNELDDLILLVKCYKCDKLITAGDSAKLSCTCHTPIHKNCAETINICPFCLKQTVLQETFMSKFVYYATMITILTTVIGGLVGTLVYAAVTK